MKAIGRIDKIEHEEIISKKYGKMPVATKGWKEKYVRFKLEGKKHGRPQINIQLGTGEGLNIFNESLIKFEKIDKE